MAQKVYEIVDTSDDEVYYPVGLFADLESAKSAIAAFEHEKISEYAEDFETIEIREREFGITYTNGKTMYTLNREEYYDEDEAEYRWRKR